MFRRKREKELEEELASHLRMAAQERIERGEDPQGAADSSRKELGNLGLIRDATSQMWGWGWAERLLQDVRFGLRTLRKDRGFTVVAVLTLALGIGANTAIFSAVHGILLQPLSFPDPGRLYGVWSAEKQQEGRRGISGPDLADFHEQSRSFDQFGAALGYFTWKWMAEGEPRIVRVTAISPEIFPMLGARPLQGRLFTPEEYHIDGGQIILSYDFWKRELGGDPTIVGRSLTIQDGPIKVVGVMPRLPDFYPRTDIWATLIPDFEFMKWRSNRFLQGFGRLRSGVAPSQAEQELTAIAHRAPETPAGLAITLSAMQSDVVGRNNSRLLAMLIGAVGLVLLIACVNVATLLLARGEARKQEIAVRVALGAGRLRLLQQLCTENLTLALLGGLAGAALGFYLLRLLLLVWAGQLPRTENVAMNFPVLAFTAAIAVLASLIFGLTPSLALIRTHFQNAIGIGFRAASSLNRVKRNLLIIAEVALSLVLVIASGLLLRSLWKVARADLGFVPDHLVAAYLRLNNEDPTAPAFYQQLLAELPQLPGVRSAAVGDCTPGMKSALASLSFSDRAPDPQNVPSAAGCWISPDYFRTTETAILVGRSFTAADNLDTHPVVIINQALARRYWPGQDALGKVITVSYFGPGRRPTGAATGREVVGIAADVRRVGEMDEPQVYLPFTQDETKHVLWGMNLFVRSKGDDAAAAASARATVHALKNGIPVTFRGMEDVLGQSLAPRRMTVFLLGGFAAMALLLSAIGIHGVVAYSVSRRTREIGVRIALGAARESVTRMILFEMLKPILAGLLMGAAGALACSRLISGMLYGTRMTEPLVLASCGVLMLAVGFAAAWLPARSAASIDPIQALRAE
ncbi:MAG TPA: ABC transporter permease [Candidatus Angelobacter sp.]